MCEGVGCAEEANHAVLWDVRPELPQAFAEQATRGDEAHIYVVDTENLPAI
jgi:hypothetical protein